VHVLRRGYCETRGKYRDRTQSRSSLTGTVNMKPLNNMSEPNIIIIELQPLLTHEGADKVSSNSRGGAGLLSQNMVLNLYKLDKKINISQWLDVLKCTFIRPKRDRV